MQRLAFACASLLAALAWLPTASAESLAVDAAASRVRIHLGRAGIGKFLGHEHEIEAKVAEGRVEVVAGAPERSSVRLRFESRRLAIVPGTEPAKDVAAVEERMRGPEVLDVERYPLITFVSTAVSASGPGADGSTRLEVAGRLELKGTPRDVRIPVLVRRVSNALVAEGETLLELRALGVEPPSVAGAVKVANQFRLRFEIHAGAAPAR